MPVKSRGSPPLNAVSSDFFQGVFLIHFIHTVEDTDSFYGKD